MAFQRSIDPRAAAGATLTLPSAQTSDIGSYSVLATGLGGATVSRAVLLTVNAAGASDSRLVNLAVRTTAGTGDAVLFVGLVVGGSGTSGAKPLLIRAVGPTLSAFGVTGVLADPKLELFESGGTTPLAVNDNWSGDARITAITPQVGAFSLAPNDSKDAALYMSPAAGGYTVQISGADAATGTTHAEIYDASPGATFTAATPRLINVSARTQVGTGGNILVAGFAIGGTGSKTILVRARGWSGRWARRRGDRPGRWPEHRHGCRDRWREHSDWRRRGRWRRGCDD